MQVVGGCPFISCNHGRQGTQCLLRKSVQEPIPHRQHRAPSEIETAIESERETGRERWKDGETEKEGGSID